MSKKFDMLNRLLMQTGAVQCCLRDKFDGSNKSDEIKKRILADGYLATMELQNAVEEHKEELVEKGLIDLEDDDVLAFEDFLMDLGLRLIGEEKTKDMFSGLVLVEVVMRNMRSHDQKDELKDEDDEDE